MISDKSTFPPVIYSVPSQHPPPPNTRTRRVSSVPHTLFSRSVHALSLPLLQLRSCRLQVEKKKQKYNKSGWKKAKEIIGNSTLGHASMVLFMRFAVFYSFPCVVFVFCRTRSPWIFAIMETNVGLLNLSIGLPKVAKAKVDEVIYSTIWCGQVNLFL